MLPAKGFAAPTNRGDAKRAHTPSAMSPLPLLHLANNEVGCPADKVIGLSDSFEHVWTNAALEDDEVWHGTTRWACGLSSTLRAWIEWDWLEVSPAVIAQENPLGIRTSLTLLDAAGQRLGDYARTLKLSPLLALFSRRTPSWQEHVMRAMSEKGWESRRPRPRF